MVLIAPAPDFTEALMRPGLPPEALRELEMNGLWMARSDYGEPYADHPALPRGRPRWSILPGPVPIDCPVRILQGGARR